MNITKRQLSLTLSLLCFAAASVYASPNQDQSAFHHYCNGIDLEFEQQVQVAPGRRVLINHSAFPLIEQSGEYLASATFIEQQMIAAGVQGNCAEYLLSHAKSWQGESKDALARVYFSFNSTELTSASRYLLNQLLTRLKTNNALSVEGHTDNIGSEEYNFSLGLRRSESVAAYLNQNAQHPLQLQTVSYGEKRPISSNASETGRAQNRRVEIK
ncbi:OmpA family protein [Vibrio furnissii]|uniref:OmpA family protein n=1 Tax=Vibrio furnissii TaxID=29494 RepID=UPI001C9BC29B|nr:OmpA family protein [Vibrio fluvialis]MBY8103816.1 OmpA family protein [Vibrio fluvialis]MBY8152095.1 OmpA family protein [Vibrio fluvialis]MBY8181146.1 OmpA family protein [Vibrio fluvialis]MBY8203612.1 OmpA family protein [Vibrio fluvialis]